MSLGLIASQPFTEDGRMICLEPKCAKPIEHGEFFVEIQQYDCADANPKLAVHADCLVNGFLGVARNR